MAYDFDYRDPPEFYLEIIQLAMCGLSIEEIGDYYGLDPLDWVEWCKEHPLVENKVNCGKAKGLALAGQELIKQIKQGKVNAMMFYLKTKGSFTEKDLSDVDTQHGQATSPPELLNLDPTEAAKRYKDWMQNS
jgi:hypothetical protein